MRAAGGGLVAAPRYPPSMACRITELVLDCHDVEAQSRFWCEVLGFVVLDEDDDEDAIEIGPADAAARAAGPTLVLQRSSDVKTGKLRLHVDVNATDRDQAQELERLLALGARPGDVGQTGDESWHVLLDPEGNEFCLLARRVDPA